MARAYATGSAWQRWRQELRPLLTMRRVRARLAPRPYGRLGDRQRAWLTVLMAEAAVSYRGATMNMSW